MVLCVVHCMGYLALLRANKLEETERTAAHFSLHDPVDVHAKLDHVALQRSPRQGAPVAGP